MTNEININSGKTFYFYQEYDEGYADDTYFPDFDPNPEVFKTYKECRDCAEYNKSANTEYFIYEARCVAKLVRPSELVETRIEPAKIEKKERKVVSKTATV